MHQPALAQAHVQAGIARSTNNVALATFSREEDAGRDQDHRWFRADPSERGSPSHPDVWWFWHGLGQSESLLPLNCQFVGQVPPLAIETGNPLVQRAKPDSCHPPIIAWTIP